MDLPTLFIGALVLLWGLGLLVGIVYLRGGGAAVRRMTPQLAIIFPIALLVVIAESVIIRNGGDGALTLVLLAVGLVILARGIRRYRRTRITAPHDASASTALTPQMRNFALIAIAVVIVGSILMSFLASKAGL
jgi:hypothetical protein